MELKRRKQGRRGSARRSVYERESGDDAEDPTPPGEDEKAPGPDRAAGGTVATKEGKVTSLFVTTDPGAPSKRTALIVDEFGHVRKSIEAESEEAASHWDRRVWHPL